MTQFIHENNFEPGLAAHRSDSEAINVLISHKECQLNNRNLSPAKSTMNFAPTTLNMALSSPHGECSAGTWSSVSQLSAHSQYRAGARNLFSC